MFDYTEVGETAREETMVWDFRQINFIRFHMPNLRYFLSIYFYYYSSSIEDAEYVAPFMTSLLFSNIWIQADTL